MKSIIVLFEVKSVKREKKRGFDLSLMFEPLLTGAEPAPKKHSCNLHALLYESFPLRRPAPSSEQNFPHIVTHILQKAFGGQAQERWRNVMLHRMSRKEGREKLFEGDYQFV